MGRTVIIGGGIIGLLTAYELQQRGEKVTVLDKGELGRGSSEGNAGWITPSLSGPVPAPGLIPTSLRWMLHRDSPLYIKPSAVPQLAPWLLGFWRHCNARDYEAGLRATAELGAPTMELYDALKAKGVKFEMHQTGLLFACLSPESISHVTHDVGAMREFGYEDPPLILGKNDLHDFEPTLSPAVQAGVWVKEERHVRPETLTGGVAEWLDERGVELHTATEVCGLRRRGRRVTTVETRVGELEADQVLIAAGAWSGQVAKLAGFRLPITAGKGYNMTLYDPKMEAKHAIYVVEKRIAVSPFNGAIRMSGTMELSGINTYLDQRRVGAIRSGANRYFGKWERGSRETTWTGMRPMAPDGLPVIGKAPGYDNLWVASGHAMMGISLGPATAQVTADLMTSGSTRMDMQPFDPSRFGLIG